MNSVAASATTVAAAEISATKAATAAPGSTRVGWAGRGTVRAPVRFGPNPGAISALMQAFSVFSFAYHATGDQRHDEKNGEKNEGFKHKAQDKYGFNHGTASENWFLKGMTDV